MQYNSTSVMSDPAWLDLISLMSDTTGLDAIPLMSDLALLDPISVTSDPIRLDAILRVGVIKSNKAGSEIVRSDIGGDGSDKAGFNIVKLDPPRLIWYCFRCE